MQVLILSKLQIPFDLDLTFSCGQVFGWKKHDDIWSGVFQSRRISVKQEGNTLWYSGCPSQTLISFLGLNEYPSLIIRSIREHIHAFNNGEKDQFFERAYTHAEGLRILRQDPWECLFSFICSSNSNVRTIGKRINSLMEKFGEKTEPDFFGYPCAHALSESQEQELRECLTGYRAPYLIQSARYICENPEFFDRLVHMEYHQAKKTLMILSGVGPKVADCVLLFAFARFEAVPVDIRIRTIMEKQYHDKIRERYATDTFSYDMIADFCREYFGPYAGYAQQYLFATRDFLKQ